MLIKATTPTRIDLAGGTLDLYPLYLFEEGGLTVNCAINMYCLVTLEPRNDKQIHLTSIDLNIHEQFANIDSISTAGPLEIVSRAVKFFRPGVGLNVTTENRVVKGSGLGASSSLLIATLAALNELMNSVYSSDELIDFAADIEAQCIRIPTGKQDYFAAVFGGVSALWFEVGGNQREDLLKDGDGIAELENRIILSFTGAPRFSGATNWSMIKNYIDNNPGTLAGMKQIKETAIAMRECILARNWKEFASVVNREWLNRRTLAEGVTNEQVETVMRAARSAGALANKLCGAGGGGCMITCVEPQDRSRVETALNAVGAQVLPFKIVKNGVKVERIP
ncbi:GHMP kinase [Candidatus Poribacteria bacterium]|nr:GHMP kinase [Candidatus Poribacteria bacterium]